MIAFLASSRTAMAGYERLSLSSGPWRNTDGTSFRSVRSNATLASAPFPELSRQRYRYHRLARREARVVRISTRSGHGLHAVPDDLWFGQRRDVFGSLFAVAAGALVIGSGVAPGWLRWALILAGIVFFLQGFGLGGVIASFGLVLDLIGFALFLIFVLVSSVILLTRERRAPLIAGGIELDNLVQASSATR